MEDFSNQLRADSDSFSEVKKIWFNAISKVKQLIC